MKKTMLIWAVLLTTLPGISGAAGKDAPKKPPRASSDAMATVGDWSLKASDVDSELAGIIYDQDVQLYKQRTAVVQERLANQLLQLEAKGTSTPVDVLLRREVLDKVPDVSQDDVKKFMEQNKDRLPNKGEGMEDRVKQMMKSNIRERVFEEYIVSLGNKHEARVNIPRPVEPTFKVDAPADVSRGPAAASVTVVEFSDFECPYCKKAAATLKEVENLYGSKIRVAYRNYTMPSHANALNAAEAALCAAEQGKFWEYHDTLFANTDKLGGEDLKRYAGQLGLDTAQFIQCTDSNRNIARAQKDARDASRLGVTGTPTFFINGKRLVGAQPVSEFQKVIDAELSRKKK